MSFCPDQIIATLENLIFLDRSNEAVMPALTRYTIIALAIIGFCALGYLIDWWAIYRVYDPILRIYYEVESVQWEIMGYRAFYNDSEGRVWTLSFFQSFMVLSMASIALLAVFSRRKPTEERANALPS